MKLCRLLGGYRRATWQANYHREGRGSTFGIAVGPDYHAREYQKWQRRAEKCFDMLTKRLYQIDKIRT